MTVEVPFPDWIHPDGHTRSPQELLLHERLLTWDIREGENVVIVGGYTGTVAQLLVDRYPKAELWVYEPQEVCCEQLRARFALYTNVHIKGHALGTKTGMFPMTRIGTDAASFVTGRYAQMAPSEPESMEYQLEISRALLSEGLHDIALLFMNCEQCEYFLLPHLARLHAFEYIAQVCFQAHSFPFIEECEDAATLEDIEQMLERTHQLAWESRDYGGWFAWTRRPLPDVRARLEELGVIA